MWGAGRKHRPGEGLGAGESLRRLTHVACVHLHNAWLRPWSWLEARCSQGRQRVVGAVPTSGPWMGVQCSRDTSGGAPDRAGCRLVAWRAQQSNGSVE